jgi:hypothetical protein
MGYLGYASLFTLIMALILVVYNVIDNARIGRDSLRKTVKITIPEDLDYTGAFDDLFDRYTTSHELVRVKTTNMGSMFRLTYNLTLRNSKDEKAFIDEIRCRNGNLEIMVSKEETQTGEL